MDGASPCETKPYSLRRECSVKFLGQKFYRFIKEIALFPLKDTNPSIKLPVVTWGLIALNLAVYIYQISLGAEGAYRLHVLYGLVPARVLSCFECATLYERFSPLLSHMFLHGSLWHIISNMYFLFIFGDNVEDKLGHVKFLLFYILFGLGAGMGQMIFNLGSAVPMIGASGAVAGVMGAYLIFFPKAKIKTLIFIIIFISIIDIPAVVFLLIWFLLQFYNGVSVSGTAGVAWWAHVGGFVVGVLIAISYRKREGRPVRKSDFIYR